eukprot:COSAG06_NODE_22534_length_720_cov_1.254428_2_plen_184_part_01
MQKRRLKLTMSPINFLANIVLACMASFVAVHSGKKSPPASTSRCQPSRASSSYQGFNSSAAGRHLVMMRVATLLALLSATNARPLPLCSGDFHGDGDVDVADLLTVLESFQVNSGGDTDGSCGTDTVDLLNVISQFGEACRASTGGSHTHGCTCIPPSQRSLHFLDDRAANAWSCDICGPITVP